MTAEGYMETEHTPPTADLSRIRTPIRPRFGRSERKVRCTSSGMTWHRPDDVPGAVLSASVERELHEQLRAFTEHNRRAAVSARSYAIWR